MPAAASHSAQTIIRPQALARVGEYAIEGATAPPRDRQRRIHRTTSKTCRASCADPRSLELKTTISTADQPPPTANIDRGNTKRRSQLPTSNDYRPLLNHPPRCILRRRAKVATPALTKRPRAAAVQVRAAVEGAGLADRAERHLRRRVSSHTENLSRTPAGARPATTRSPALARTSTTRRTTRRATARR